ncbi:uncharacterized protein K460DRAFT_293272 [Cucurbitaria berberidis CBS 394.84]|uniref:F-box domain-containing protein n=1 Tax=Cucurbitaria berberidis CBS 394.84 TaxID=1168544 RepID=A0A9P4L4V0_9PLEO|nr:uncharacterized protein K460DRAFT_293272 [Cucurbitaria berberidis CBS 394.84]KAF1841687.1 hypothetical protein K460DRAFT_293272 [Cucurbitaria berberidis CBS 394.84]
MVTIDTLPAELINEVIGYLRPHDLTKLARVSKKYRKFAQPALWRNIELHRQDAHHDCFGLSNQPKTARAYLDDQLRDSWSYRGLTGTDFDFDRRNAKFGAAIRKLYRAAGKSQAWSRLAPCVRQLCLTVTHKSPQHIWSMILSLPNLDSVEVIGEYSADNQGPPAVAALREPAATKIRNVRLRGYIPRGFVSAMCKASVSSIVSLDTGILEPPQLFEGDAEEMEFQNMQGFPLYVGPRGVLWYTQESWSPFSSLTHLLLCKRGAFDSPLDMSEEEDLDIREDEAHEVKEIKQWASLLLSVRSTVVEIVLEKRPIYLDYLLDMGMDISSYDQTEFIPDLDSFDSDVYHRILKGVFADGGVWPNLRKVTFRGINLHGFEAEAGEALQAFTTRVLPGVQIEQVRGNYMFFNTRKGTVKNQHGADGLKSLWTRV